MGAIRDIVSRAGPMSEGRKSVAFSQNAKASQSDKSPGKGIVNDAIKLLEATAIYEKPDLGNSAMEGALDRTYMGRKMIRDKIQTTDSPDGKSKASKRSKRRQTIAAAGAS